MKTSASGGCTGLTDFNLSKAGAAKFEGRPSPDWSLVVECVSEAWTAKVVTAGGDVSGTQVSATCGSGTATLVFDFTLSSVPCSGTVRYTITLPIV